MRTFSALRTASSHTGNVIECRINAENPEKGFRPSCGRITRLHTPGGAFVRFDTAIYQDYFVPPYYDSMIGKLIVQARSRAEAIRKMKMALSELTIDGIDINRDLLAEILSDEQFVSGEYTTDFMAEFGEEKPPTCHRTRFLNIIKPCIIIWMFGWCTCFIIIIKTIYCPWYRL